MTMLPPSPASGFNKFATGNKTYGAGQIGAATSGPLDKTGYLARDQRRRARAALIQNTQVGGLPADTMNPILKPGQ